MNFVLERETFTSVPVWVRLYSLPLDYWQTELLTAIGNKLGRFVKALKATRRGKYTSFAQIYVEMDLSGALLDELILEVFYEEWVQTVDYEHFPFRCHRCHEHGCLMRDFPLSKIENKTGNSILKDMESFQKVSHRGKGSKRGLKQHQAEGPQVTQNRFQVLEEEEETIKVDQGIKESPKDKETQEDKDQPKNNNIQKEAMMSDVELDMGQEVTQSEMEMEDQELQEILDREHLDLEGFLK